MRNIKIIKDIINCIASYKVGSYISFKRDKYKKILIFGTKLMILSSKIRL